MNLRRYAIAAIALLSVGSICQAQTVRRWDFSQSADREGWAVPAERRGVMAGGSMWLTLSPRETDPAVMAKWTYQAFGDVLAMLRDKKPPFLDTDLVRSPSGLQLSAQQANQVRLRVLNLSSITDLYLQWRTPDQTWTPQPADWVRRQSRRCTLKPDSKEWQEVICPIDPQWRGTIDQFAIRDAMSMSRGDLWIDWIDIRQGSVEPARARPDVASARVVPRIVIPGLSQEGFAEAFRVLDRCLIVDVPVFGFNYSVMEAGTHYRDNWWLLDSSLAVTGAQWANPKFAEDVMRGFSEEQAANPDGRIDMTGSNPIRGQPGSLSAMPRLFDVAYDVARRTPDDALRAKIYEMMRKYVDWWLSPVKRDARTGLVSAVLYDETFADRDQGPHLTHLRFSDMLLSADAPMKVAPTDTNVAVAVGAARVAELAEVLGKAREAAAYRREFEALKSAINTYLWDEARGAYYNYDLQERTRREGLIVSTFDPLRLQIAPLERRARLINLMTDPKQFNWGQRPLTSWAKTDPGYVEAEGLYDGRAWFGDIWTIRNMPIVDGLEESGRPDLAAELNWQTIQMFHHNYYEFVGVASGRGGGSADSAASAGQYIGAIVEHLFGVDYDWVHKRLRIAPHVPKALYGRELRLENLVLPTDDAARLSVSIKQYGLNAGQVTARITGPLPEGSVVISLSGDNRQITMPVRPDIMATFP